MHRFLLFETFGIVVIGLAGSALHFAYAWSGESWPVAVFAAVNESVWEHLKLAFWPAMAWSGLGFLVFGHRLPGFWAGRLVALALPPLVIALGFYGYMALVGHHSLLADMVLFVGAIAVGQLAAVGIYHAPAPSPGLSRACGALIVMLCLAFGGLTFMAPDLFLFREP